MINDLHIRLLKHMFTVLSSYLVMYVTFDIILALLFVDRIVYA